MHNIVRTTAAAIVMLAGAGAVRAAAEDGSGTLLKGKAAFGSWQQDKPGLRRLIKPQDLPPVGKSTPNFSEVAPMPPGAKPRVPPGFLVEMVASGYAGPRAIRVAPNGDLFFADSASNTIHVLRVPSGTASPTKNEVFASGLTQPFGIAFYPLGPNPEWVYVANSDGVVRFPYKNGDLIATGKPEQIVGHIPWVHHWTRDIAFTPDGKRLLLSVGSGSNVALDMFPEPEVKGGLQAWIKSEPLGAAWDTEERRADVLSYDPDGKNEKILATGLRNCAGITIQPATGLPWCVVNERDELGDNTPFEYATAVKDSSFYGWCPASYKGSAFVALHGSWNRAERTGYKVVRLLFDNAGKPTGEYEDFMTGFVISDKQVWGRPVGVAVAKDGSLFVTEDGNGTIWRVSHQKVASNN
jgi:glucose/arabinose dehydrogenase